jgi:hypothetical protein
MRQEILEKARHRHLVFIIGAHLGGVLRVRKCVRGAAVEVDLEVHLGGAELRDHGIEFVHRRNRIFGAVQDENATLDALGGNAAIERQTQFVSRGSWESEVKSGTVEVYGKAPNRMLTVMDVPGFGQIRDGFDGSVAWHEDPQVGVQEINGRESSAIRRMAEFYGDLKLRQLYPKIITKGKQNVGQRAAYVVEADSGDGLFRRMYFDTQIGLLLRGDTEYDTPEGRASVTRYFDDYRDVDAVKMTFTVRQSDKNGSLTFRLTESRFDVALDDAVFARPTAGTTIGSEAPPELPVTSSISAAAQSEQSGTTPTARGVNEGLAVM